MVKEAISRGNIMVGVYTKLDNLADILTNAAEQSENGVTFIQNNESERFVSYKELKKRAIKRLSGLQKKGMKPNDYAILVLEENEEFIVTFWACILGGIIPAPLSYPTSLKVKNASLDKLEVIWEILDKPYILSDEKVVKGRSEALFGQEDMEIINTAALDEIDGEGEVLVGSSDTPAFIQFSSGSTSIPKESFLLMPTCLLILIRLSQQLSLRRRTVH